MQTTLVSTYSLRQVLRQNKLGINVAGYTVRPGFSNGLFLGPKNAPRGQVQGYRP